MYTLPFMLPSIKSLLSTIVQFLSYLGLFLEERKEIAIGEDLKRWCCGRENSTKLWQVEHPPVKFHHQSWGP